MVLRKRGTPLERKEDGMPSKMKGLEVLLKNPHMSKEDWIEFLGARLKLIKPLLDRFTLETLGDVRYLKTKNSRFHDLRDDNPQVVFNGFLGNDKKVQNLNIQGIFPTHERLAERNAKNKGKMILWGLSRERKWLWIEIEFSTGTVSEGEKSHGLRGYEKAETVTIAELSLRKMFSDSILDPGEVEKQITLTVDGWISSHKQTHEQIKEIEWALTMEKNVLELKEKASK